MCTFGDIYTNVKETISSFVKNVVVKTKCVKNEDIALIRREKCIAYNNYLITENVADLEKYDELSKKFKKAVNDLKRVNLQNTLEKYKHDSKKLWVSLKDLYKPQKKNIKFIMHGNQTICDPIQIGNCLNTFFVSSIKEIVDNIEKPRKENYNDFIIPPVEKFEISTIDEKNLKLAVDRIKKKTFDDFVFGHNIVDLLNDERLRKTFLQAINESIMSSKMPDNMKISIISPIAKVEKPEKPEDYRPVNNLPVFEKLLEVIVLEQLKDFLDSSNILTNVQHGFRS